MSIPIPDFDDRSFDDLMKEALSLIPIYNKEWTNHNPTDPGITLLELFAWLCEMVIYRVNRVPDESYINFLKLLSGTPKETELDKLLNVPFLFNWNSTERTEEFRNYLKNELYIDWVDDDTEVKIDGNVLRAISGKNRADMILDSTEDKEKAVLKINGAQIRYFRVDGDLNINNVPDLDVNYRHLLETLKEFMGGEKKYLPELKETAIGFMESRHRVITTEDFVDKAMEGMERLKKGLGGRAICMNNRDLAPGKLGDEKPGHVSVILIPNWIEGSYLFSWNDIPGNDNKRLIGFLKKRFDIEWADNAKIKKNDDGKTIRLSFENNFLSLKLNDDEIKVILKIDDVRTDEFIAKTEKDKLNIYESSRYCRDNLNPSDVLIEEIKADLYARRLVTTRVHVVAPFYHDISLRIQIALKENTNEVKVLTDAKEKLKKFFHPITGGPEKKGWPLGRNVYRSEVYSLLEGTEGVDHVSTVKINGNEDVTFVEIEEFELISLKDLNVEKVANE